MNRLGFPLCALWCAIGLQVNPWAPDFAHWALVTLLGAYVGISFVEEFWPRGGSC